MRSMFPPLVGNGFPAMRSMFPPLVGNGFPAMRSMFPPLVGNGFPAVHSEARTFPPLVGYARQTIVRGLPSIFEENVSSIARAWVT